MAPRHAHELEAAGEARWTGKIRDNVFYVTDEASGEEFQATAFIRDESAVRFSLPGDNGLRVLERGKPGFDELAKVVDKALGGPSEAPKPAARPAARASESAKSE